MRVLSPARVRWKGDLCSFDPSRPRTLLRKLHSVFYCGYTKILVTRGRKWMFDLELIISAM
jgi:hypothetical protein